MRLTVVTGTEVGAQDFIDNVWKGGEVLLDEEEVFKRALGGEVYKNRWLLKPSVLRNAKSFSSQNGFNFEDLKGPAAEKTQMLGGTLVISKEGEVLHEFRETKEFHNGDAQDLLNAVTGRTAATPSQAEVCK